MHAISQYLLLYCGLTGGARALTAWSAAAAAAAPSLRRRASAAHSCVISSGSRPGALRPACCLCHASTGALIGCCHPGAIAYRLAVHKDVYDLCATALSLCMLGGNAGDYAAWSCL